MKHQECPYNERINCARIQERLSTDSTSGVPADKEDELHRRIRELEDTVKELTSKFEGAVEKLSREERSRDNLLTFGTIALMNSYWRK